MAKEKSMSEESREVKGVSRNLLKLIAIITITIGHFFLYTFSVIRCFGLKNPWVGILCGICFVGPPIFMCFIAEGFRYTSSKLRYGRRLLLFAIVTQVAHAITTDQGLGFSFHTFFFEWNVFFALLLGFLALCVLSSEWKPVLKGAGVLAILALSYFMNTEWWIFGPLMILSFYYFKDKALLKWISAAALVYLTFALSDCNFGGGFAVTPNPWHFRYFLAFGVIGAGLVSFFYHGKNGKKSKWIQYFYYVFYPLHLILIDLVILLARSR